MKDGLIRRKKNVAVIPRAAAAAVVRAEQERHQRFQQQMLTASEGQQAGPPGIGEAPALVHRPGGDIIAQTQHPAFTTFERLRRKLPEEGWFDPDLGPEAPVQFQIESFTVPDGMNLWLFDYEFSAYRPSGVDPGDFIKAEAGRFSNQLGFDINISGKRDGNLSYQLDPDAVTLGRPVFENPTGTFSSDTTTKFNSSRANSFAAATNAGTSLLPVRRAVQGAEGHPFTFVVGEGGKVALNCVIFNTVSSPLSCVEGRMAGYLIHTQVSTALLNRVRPR